MAGVADFCKEERRDDCKKADTEDTVSPLGREADQSGRHRKSWKTWSKAERLSILERKRRPIINTSAIADTLPAEGFLEAGGLSDCLKKDWRRPAR